MEAAQRVTNDVPAPPKARARRSSVAASDGISHNLNGQRLGRKGRETRERILAAAQEILDESADTPLTLSEVARRTSLRMGSLYLYFADLTELVLAMLEPVMATAEAEYVGLARDRWADEDLGARTLQFVTAYHDFWVKHSRLLHLRNNMADRQDQRLMLHRVGSAQPVMRLLVNQMDGQNAQGEAPVFGMATALMTGLERVVTVTTDAALPTLLQAPFSPRHGNLLRAEGRLMELGIRDYRTMATSV